ncbi:hypothetical protein ACLXAY_24225, partial [Escherichia coli]
MIAIADILQAGEKLTAVAPFLAGIQNEEQYTQALELVDHLLLLNDPENPLLDLVCAKITAWEESAPEFAEFNAMAVHRTKGKNDCDCRHLASRRKANCGGTFSGGYS